MAVAHLILVVALQIVAAVADKRQLSQEDAGKQVRDAFQALVMDRYVEQAPPSSLPLPPPPVFAKLTVSSRSVSLMAPT